MPGDQSTARGFDGVDDATGVRATDHAAPAGATDDPSSHASDKAGLPKDDPGSKMLPKEHQSSQGNCELIEDCSSSSSEPPEPTRNKLYTFACKLSNAAPFAAAIMAPLSTFLDIPGLTMRWYLTNDGGALPDPAGNIALSALGLAFNLLANALLLARFSTGQKWWRTATVVSVVAWWIKTIIAAVNVGVFSTYRGAANATDTTLSGGFWAAVASLTLASIISLLLGGHLAWEALVVGKESKAASIDARTAGRHFQLLVMLQIVLIALFSLLVALVEQFTYSDAIYFSVVTLLTIGFGDLTPSHTVTRVILFFYALVSIALLANLVGEIASWMSDRQAVKRTEWRIRTEAEARKHADHRSDSAKRTLGEEIAFLKQVARSQAQYELMSDLAISFALIAAYWMIGAMVYALIKPEELGFGSSTYMIYVAFLTIGYGDFSPTSAGGRVFFIVYALAGVPIITSFAVQSFTAILSTVADRKFEQFKLRRSLDEHHEAYRPHGRMVLHFLSTTDSHLTGAEFDIQTLKVRPSGKPTSQAPDATDETSSASSDAQTLVASKPTAATSERHAVEREDPKDLPGGEEEHAVNLADVDPDPLRRKQRLTELVVALSLRLEARSRRLLINTLEPGSPAQLLLRADMNIQARDVRMLNSEMTEAADGDSIATLCGEVEENTMASPLEDTLQLVGEYRMTFAAMLAAASRLKDLDGLEQCAFERRLTEDQMPKQSHLPFSHDFARATKADSPGKALKRFVTMA